MAGAYSIPGALARRKLVLEIVDGVAGSLADLALYFIPSRQYTSLAAA